ncbi:hypothetical protein BGZ95_004091 [Linnemannia exigua]|uniref:Uncharacterized protein n=1 Tax=Linnemannia exigua TaxID=604196 RepID=A0AAD4H9F7_9FUNG|nr:hypothetical protein BGZ95_004091 [Linnemannia exigua]
MISFITPLHSSSPSTSSPPRTPHSHNNQLHCHNKQDHQQQQQLDQKTFSRSTMTDNSNKPRYYSIFSELNTQQADQRQRALQQFPCEERHSYNPHYQHNLVSSPTYSSPPSLCPSSAGSSPSSAYSSGSGSSTSSLSRATEDDSYNGSASMACAQPQDPLVVVSSSSTAAPSLSGSLRSSFSRRDRPQVSNGSLSVATSQTQAKQHRRPTVTFSPVVLHHPAAGQDITALSSFSFSSSPVTSLASAPAKLSPSIAESSMGLNSSMAMATAKAESTSIIQQQQQQPTIARRMTAKQSLMRIAQLSKDQDGWCSHKAGQYTQGYAEARSRGMKLDGRRARRL